MSSVSSLRRRAAGSTLLAVAGALACVAVATAPARATGPAPVTARVAPATATTADIATVLPSQAEVALAMSALGGPRQRATNEHASRSDARAPLHRWVRPNDGPLSSPFGYRWGRLHAGIDLAGAYGSPILAATDGCITYAGPEEGYGEVITIADWDGTETVYGHMSAFERTSGCVHAGEVIALVGAAGDATGAHLHFEVHVGGVPVDPIPFLARRGVAI